MSLLTPPARCPNCGAPIILEPYPPIHEVARCGNCLLRSPRFARYQPPANGSPDGITPPRSLALQWLEQVSAPPDSRLEEVARRVAVAYMRRDEEAFDRAVERLCALLRIG